MEGQKHDGWRLNNGAVQREFLCMLETVLDGIDPSEEVPSGVEDDQLVDFYLYSIGYALAGLGRMVGAGEMGEDEWKGECLALASIAYDLWRAE